MWHSMVLKHKRHMLTLNKDITQKAQLVRRDGMMPGKPADNREATTPHRLNDSSNSIMETSLPLSWGDREEGELLSDNSRVSTPVTNSCVTTTGLPNAKISLQTYYQKRKTDKNLDTSSSAAASFQSQQVKIVPQSSLGLKRSNMEPSQTHKRPRDEHHSTVSVHHDRHHQKSSHQRHRGDASGHHQHYHKSSRQPSHFTGTEHHQHPTSQVPGKPLLRPLQQPR